MERKAQLSRRERDGPCGRLSGRVVLVAVVVVVVVVCVVVTVVVCLPSASPHTHEDCGVPTEDDCLEEMLLGSPMWDEPQLLQVVKEEFLRPPEAASPTTPVSEDHLTKDDLEIVRKVTAMVGEVEFVVAATGESPALVGTLGKTGLWLDPRPEDQPGHSPVPHLWYSHACLSDTVPYLNKQKQQCISLASLLVALGRPSVDLVLAHALKPSSVFHALCTQYTHPVKAVMMNQMSLQDLLLDQYRDCFVNQYGLGNSTIIFLKQ
nr:uncharacterized protein LOC123746885 [Procambarus clarkii]